MIIFPAIDIQNGKVVRLMQGKFDAVTQYALDPVDVARQWQSDGAEWLHVVDLDGAKTGVITNLLSIQNILKSVNVPVQVGGGVRRKEDVEALIESGVSRVVLGTKAIQDKVFFMEVLKRWENKIAISLDCNNGFLAQRGWTETTNIRATDFIKSLENSGLACVIFTDIARDGMLSGPNLAALREILAATKIPVIASGGVSKLKDIEDLVGLENDGLLGAITGKALYEGKLDLKQAIRAARGGKK